MAMTVWVRLALPSLCMLLGVAWGAKAQSITPRRLVEVVDIQGPVISPDGSLVAFRIDRPLVDSNRYDATWYVQATAGGALPRPAGQGGFPLRDTAGMPLPELAVWSPDSRWIYYRASVNGRIDVWRAAADGSRAEVMTRDGADVRRFELDADGRGLKYAVGATREEVSDAEEAEYAQGFLIDARAAIGQGLFRSGLVDGRLGTQRLSADWFGRSPLLADRPDRWKSLDLPGRGSRDLVGNELPSAALEASSYVRDGQAASRVALDPGSSRVALLIPSGDGRGLADKPSASLSVLKGPKKRQGAVCEADLCTDRMITGVLWRPGSEEVLFTVTDPLRTHAQAINAWDVSTGGVREVVATDGLINGGRELSSDCGASSDFLVCVTAAANQPPRLERIDLGTGKRQVLFEPNAGLAQDLDTQVQVKPLRWSDSSGQQFSGQFFPARGKGGPPPLFVAYYSCPGFLRGGLGDEWPLVSLAQHGIAVLCINRVHAFDLDAAKRYGQGLSALRSAIDLLAGQGEIDRHRIGMGGLSFGSEVTMWSMVYSDLITAASISTPTLTPTYALMGGIKGEPFAAILDEYWQIGLAPQTSGQWKVLSHDQNLDKISAPLLMQMSEQEYLYALDYAVPLIREHRAELYAFANEPHQKFQPQHKLAVYERNLDWFRFWLLGEEDTDPAKREQYARWRVMRSKQPHAQAQR
jgi:dipeptidyl aminopeptidase/acylaminoacyl peptidase